MRATWLTLSLALHGAAVGTAIGFGACFARNTTAQPARIEWTPSEPAAVPPGPTEPMPTVVAEPTATEWWVEVLAEAVIDRSDERWPPAAAPIQDTAPAELPFREHASTPTRERVVAPVPPLAAPAPAPPPAVVEPPPPAPYVEAKERGDNAPPNYPDTDRRAGHEGVVVVAVDIDEFGSVTSVALRTPCPFAGLNREALRAARRWKFEPARERGIAVASTIDISIEFRLLAAAR